MPDLADAVGMPLDDGATLVAKALEAAGYKTGELWPVKDGTAVEFTVTLHDGPGEATITVSL